MITTQNRNAERLALRVSVFPVVLLLVLATGAAPDLKTNSVSSPDVDGGFQLTAALPGNADVYGDAVLLVTTRNCAEPSNAKVSARLVLKGEDANGGQEIKLRNVGEGEYAVDRQWAASARGVLVVDGAYEKYRAGLIIGLDGKASFEGDGRWVGRLKNGYPTRLLDRNVASRDVRTALQRLGD